MVEYDKYCLKSKEKPRYVKKEGEIIFTNYKKYKFMVKTVKNTLILHIQKY